MSHLVVSSSRRPSPAPATDRAGAARVTAASALALALAVAACDDAAPEPDGVTPQQRRALELRVAASNAHDWDTWQALHVPSVVRTAPGLSAPLTSSAELRAAIEALVVTFPDYHLELRETFGAGERVLARFHTRATMLGPLVLGPVTIPATGRTFEQDWVALVRFEGGLIASIDEFYDNYEVMTQLGLAP